MVKKVTSTWQNAGSNHLYSIDDVEKVNAMRVHCCKSSTGSWNIDRSKAYSAKELNCAWKKVKK